MIGSFRVLFGRNVSARRPCLAVTLATVVPLAALLVLAPSLARAEDGGAGQAATASPVDEFSQQLEAFQKSVPDLNKSIQDAAGAIDGTSDVGKARAEIDQLRASVSTLLSAVSDNGPVSQLGVKALDHVHAKLKELSADNRFKPEERQFLIDQWKSLEVQTENATKEARRRPGAVRRAVADIAGERRFHRRTGRDPPGAEGDRGDP